MDGFVSKIKLKAIRWGESCAARRFLLVAGVFTCTLYLLIAVSSLSRHINRLTGVTAFIHMLCAFMAAFMLVRLLRRSATVLQFDAWAEEEGIALDGLAGERLSDAFSRYSREVRRLNVVKRGGDEREVMLQESAERRAYALLRRWLPMGVLLYWAICILLPANALRNGLVVSALVFSAVALVTYMLPDFLRVWSERDERMEELKLVRKEF